MGGKILILLLAVASCHCLTKNELAAKIPENLKECYNGSNMMVKDNLLPMTMKVFIQLIKKVEVYMGSVSSRTLAPALLKRFRFDGIQRNPNVEASDLVIPYSPKGNEFFLYRMLMQYFISDSGLDIANDTFTLVERCTLHQMLSTSIDPWERSEGDSVCGQLSKHPQFNLKRKPRSVSTPAAQIEEALVGAPRATTPDEEVEVLPKKEEQVSSEDLDDSHADFMHTQQDTDYPLSACPIENGVIYDRYGAISGGVLLAGIASGLQPQQVAPNTILELRTRSNPGGIGGRGDQLPRKPVNRKPTWKVRDSADPSGRSPPGGGGGMYQPTAIDNKWASTVSGLLSMVALLQGPLSSTPQHYKIGIDGGWNDTSLPRYYFINDQVSDAFTTARIRAAIDGLIIASNVDNWNSMSGSELKLSQLLDMYYSDSGVFDKNMKACNRKSYTSQAMPLQTMQEQTFSFSKVLQDGLPSSVNVEDEGLRVFSDETTRQLNSYISSMSDPPCALMTSGLNAVGSSFTSIPAVDLHVIVDCSWDNVQLMETIMIMGMNLYWDYPGSNMTFVNAKTGVEIYTATGLLDVIFSLFLVCNRTASTGFDMRLSMNRLKMDMNLRLDWEKRVGNIAGTVPRVVLFLPSATAMVPDSDRWYIKDKLAYFKTNNPDVKFLYLVPGSRDKFTQYADIPEKDVFTINPTDPTLEQFIIPLVNRIAEIPRRIINPTCGAAWESGSYGTLQLNGYLDQNEVHYYRVQPNYFYKNANAKISVQSADGSVVLNVCSSRNNANPVSNNTGNSGSVSCKQVSGGRGVDMWLSDSLCPNSYATSCNPFYFSVSASQASQSGPSVARCLDTDCRLPTMTKYVISHQGLSCYSGVANLIASPVVIFFTIFSLLLARN